MRQAAVFALAAALMLLGVYFMLGFSVAYQLGYGLLACMAVMISVTFSWLYAKKLTPLALGMAVSWAGAALVIGWWWVYAWSGRPGWMLQSPVLLTFLAFYLVGAVLHFVSIERAFGWPKGASLWALVVSLGLSSLAFLAQM